MERRSRFVVNARPRRRDTVAVDLVSTIGQTTRPISQATPQHLTRDRKEPGLVRSSMNREQTFPALSASSSLPHGVAP